MVWEPFTGVDISASAKSAWLSLTSTQFKLPKKFRITICGNNFDLCVFEIPFSFIPSTLRNSIFPTSINWPGRTASSGNHPTITGFTGQGVRNVDVLIGSCFYSTLGVVMWQLASVFPKLCRTFINIFFNASQSQNPTLKNVISLLGVPHGSDWEPSGDDMYEVIIAIPINPLLVSDSRLDHLNADIDDIPLNPLLTTDSRLNNLNAPIGSIPTTPLLASDSRLNNLNAPISAIPTTPLLTTDSRLNNLNAPISAIPTTPLLSTDNRLDNLNAPISAIPTNPLLTVDSRLNNLNAPIGNIPVNPLLSNDSRLNYLNEYLSVLLTNINEIPINPLLSTDSRLDYLNCSLQSIYNALNGLIDTVDSIEITINSIDSEMSSVVPGKLKYIVTQVYNELNDEGEGSILYDITLIVSLINTLSNLIQDWIGWINNMTVWLQNPNMSERPTPPS